jgi:hypothetical protein
MPQTSVYQVNSSARAQPQNLQSGIYTTARLDERLPDARTMARPQAQRKIVSK